MLCVFVLHPDNCVKGLAMISARANVTPIDRARPKQTVFASTPLDSCREISTLRLSEALDAALQLIMDKLHKLADKAPELDMYHLYMDATDLIRNHHSSIQQSFRTHYLQRFNRACRRESAQQHNAKLDMTHLSLVEPDDLEKSLAAESLANSLHNACSEELFGLDKRMGLLINDPDLKQPDNPLGPEVIGHAILDCFEELSTPLKLRLLLVSMLNRHYPEQVRSIYQELNQLLIKKGVLPSIRVGMRRSRQPNDAEPSAGTSTMQASGDLFSTLQQLLSQAQGQSAQPATGHGPMSAMALGGLIASAGQSAADATAGVGGTGGAMTGTPVIAGAYMPVLNQIQRGNADPANLPGIGSSDLSSGRINVLHGLRSSPLSQSMSPMDAMTLDIVAMIFDYILDDARIPDAIKALIGRLQIPALKVAMLDKHFFSQRHHPARQLLDTLAEAAIGWDPAEGHESGLYRKIDELVLRIQNQFDQGIEIFSEVLTELQQYLAEETKNTVRAVGSSAFTIRTREASEQARQVAHDEAQSRLLGQSVPDVIRLFVAEAWEPLLSDVYMQAGENSDAWCGALTTLEQLVWSVQPKLAHNERKQLVDTLPDLLRSLASGMTQIRFPEDKRSRFLTDLVQCHADAVTAETLDTAQLYHLPEPVLDDSNDIPALSSVPMLDDFVPVEGLDDHFDDDHDLIQELSESAGTPGECISTHNTMGELKRGSWIEYRQDSETPTRMKLSWVSPLKGIYLFTNRLGQRAISISAEGLAAKMRSGEVTLIDDIPLLDQAVTKLLSRLQQQAG